MGLVTSRQAEGPRCAAWGDLQPLCAAYASCAYHLRGNDGGVFRRGEFSKWIPPAWLGLVDMRNMSTSLVLMPLAPVGVWLGVWLTRRIPSTWFYRVAYAGMLLTGVKLLWDGLR